MAAKKTNLMSGRFLPFGLIVKNVDFGRGPYTGRMIVEEIAHDESGAMESVLVSFGYDGSLGEVRYTASEYLKLDFHSPYEYDSDIRCQHPECDSVGFYKEEANIAFDMYKKYHNKALCAGHWKDAYVAFYDHIFKMV